MHRFNGVRAEPGTYDLKMPLRLTPYVQEGVVISSEDPQTHRIIVPTGHATIRYRDTNGPAHDGERCFLTRRNVDDQWVRDGVSKTTERIPLVPGEYRVEAWSRLGGYESVHFTVVAGDEHEVWLEAKGE